MYVDFYLEQMEQLTSVNLLDHRVYAQLEVENAQLIREYNNDVRFHPERLPPRKDKEGNPIPYSLSAQYQMYSRRVSMELREIMKKAITGSVGHVPPPMWPRVFPGLQSFNLDSRTVNVIITQRDMRNNTTQQMKIGKYLRRIGLGTPNEVNEWANNFNSYINLMLNCELKKATGEHIIEIYEDGPNSCMSGGGFYEGDVHPAAVYDSPDLSCAYVEILGHIKARAMLNEVDMVYSEIYGNAALLRPLLKKAGYTSGDLDGCRIRAIPYDNSDTYIMPYIDGANEVGHDGEPGYFIIGCSGYRCDNTNGLTMNGDYCPHCEEIFDLEYDGVWVEAADQTYCCDECAEADGYTYCANGNSWTGGWVRDDDAYYCETDGTHYDNTDELTLVGNDWYHYEDNSLVHSEDQDEYILEADAIYIDSIESWVDDDRADEFNDDEEEDECEYPITYSVSSSFEDPLVAKA